MSVRSSLFIATTLAILVFAQVEAATRGIPWASNDNWAGKLNTGLMRWYHHWQDGPVDALTRLEFVPTYWGPSKMGDWKRRKREMNHNWPQNILAFNEPDIEGQANMDPEWAVEEFMNELQPYADRGVKVSSPQMVWDLDWLKQFMDSCNARGCKISYIALHWYGSWNDIKDLKKWVRRVHRQYNLPIWVTEFGITSKSHPSKEQVHQFQKEAMDWFDSQPYVHRAAWNGGYSISNPPDNFATPLNALFRSGGKLRQMAYSYIYGEGNNRRSLMGGHNAMAMARRRDVDGETEEEAEPVYEGEAVHCDEICEKRNKFLVGEDDEDDDM
ncbi:hypothetical protein MCUN1_002083 [Malassezia cuniculi]|uniref:Asl1-like glycosyl hydrolase catalytic domain-containing protein n=1 Tax=Malassezia cuniculi TaxID=948313 RepID=A0AAF0J6H5_9BASI|nr:hypothetical protein MCUN1_002083 [Malassezia cuniculi]